MLQPKKTKFQKNQKGKVRGNETHAFKINFGTIGLQAVEPARLTAHQIEAARRTIIRKIKKTGKLWINVFPDIPVTKKSSEVRMGKGKGSVNHWVCRIKPGKIIFELDKISDKTAENVLKLASSKLPFKTKLRKIK